MQGEKGLQCTSDILKVLKERTEYNDSTCSLHLHLGNVPRTKEFILAFFKVGMKIQDEMFEMFPLYKKYNYHIKNKNYSAPLPTFEILSQLDPIISSDNMDINFGILYKYLSMGQDFKSVGNDINNILNHPADLNGNQKWNIRPRYLLYNIIPLIFGNKQTIEFRIHTPTYDVNKIFPFIFMNSLIVNFAIQNQDRILKNKSFLRDFNIFNILSHQIEMYNISNRNEFRDLMYDYIEKRKNYCETQILKGNILGTESEIPASTNINWLNNQVIKKNPYSSQFIEPLQYKRRSSTVSKAIPLNDMKFSTISPYDTSFYGSVDTFISNSLGIISKIEKVEPVDNLKVKSNDIEF